VSSTDYLKLTTYFGERQRSGERFLAEELLDLYGARNVATSVVLRGIAGFGPRHQLRTDQTLSQSEDLPIAIAAVDTADKITGLAQSTVDLTSRGLVTLERAQLATATSNAQTPFPSLRSPENTKLTVYVGRQHRIDGRPAYMAVCELLHRNDFAAAAVFLGVDGTVRGRRERARFLSRNIDVPVMIIAVGDSDRAAAVVPELQHLLPDPLITVERAELCKRAGRLLARPGALPPRDEHGTPLWQKLMIHTTEDTLHNGEPVHREIIRRLRQIPNTRGATVLRGIWGFHDNRNPHGDTLLQLGRQVPVMTIVVDSPGNIATAFDLIDQITTDHGVVTCERVPALVSVDSRFRDGGTTLGNFPAER
jgi:PII-like signaling protein